jgi:hypothetical protein
MAALTILLPDIHAGVWILARRGIVVVRECQLSGAAVRLIEAQRDMGRAGSEKRV